MSTVQNITSATAVAYQAKNLNSAYLLARLSQIVSVVDWSWSSQAEKKYCGLCRKCLLWVMAVTVSAGIPRPFAISKFRDYRHVIQRFSRSKMDEKLLTFCINCSGNKTISVYFERVCLSHYFYQSFRLINTWCCTYE